MLLHITTVDMLFNDEGLRLFLGHISNLHLMKSRKTMNRKTVSFGHNSLPVETC
jgi:hypothetical protein